MVNTQRGVPVTPAAPNFHPIALVCPALHCTEMQCFVFLNFSALRCTAMCCTALHCAAPCCTACAVLRCTALHCSALHCAVLHCTALHCVALYCCVLLSSALQCVTWDHVMSDSSGIYHVILSYRCVTCYHRYPCYPVTHSGVFRVISAIRVILSSLLLYRDNTHSELCTLIL